MINYTKDYFYHYVILVVEELDKRNIKYQDRFRKEIFEFCKNDFSKLQCFLPIYPEHNDRYLKQCFYNLEEKFDRGIISKEEWEEILKVAYKEDIIE